LRYAASNEYAPLEAQQNFSATVISLMYSWMDSTALDYWRDKTCIVKQYTALGTVLPVLQCDSTWNSDSDSDSDDVIGVNPNHAPKTNRKTTETTSLLVVTEQISRSTPLHSCSATALQSAQPCY